MTATKDKANVEEFLTDALENLARAIFERNHLREAVAAPGSAPEQLITLSNAERAAVAAEAAVKDAETAVASLDRPNNRR